MKANQRSGLLRHRILVACFLLCATLTRLLTQASAFHSSPSPCKQSFHTKNLLRGVHDVRSNLAFHTRSNRINNVYNNYRDHPVHVLRNYFRPQDNLFSGIAEIGMGFSVGVLYSEYFIIMTGCGPPNFGDTLERICYQGVIVFAGLALFNRIVTLKGLEDTVDDLYGPLQSSTLWQVRAAEYLSAAAVVGAIVALQVQTTKGVSMDGLSGIDINMCRAIRGDTW